MKTQSIQSPKIYNQFKVLPMNEYRLLLEKAEMLDDVAAYDQAKAALASGEDELIPSDVVNALLDGDNPVKVWRKYRGLSQAGLAGEGDVSQAYIAQVEVGSRTGTTSLYR